MHERKRLALFAVGDRLADENVLEPGDADDVALGGAFNLDFLESLVAENRRDVRARLVAGVVKANHAVADLHAAADDAPVGDPAEVVAVVEIRDEKLEIVRRRTSSGPGCATRWLRKAEAWSGSDQPARAWQSPAWRWRK